MNSQQPKDVNVVYPNGKTELHFQALSGTNPKLIKLLVQAGANLEARTMTGKTPLILAAMNDNTEIIKALLEAGANVWARDADGVIALTTAAWHNNMEAVRILLQASIYPRSELDKVLIHAVYRESLETIVALIKAGANTSVRTPDGATLLMTAVKKANLEIITMLLNLSPHVIFGEGETIPKYVGIDAQTKVGETALMFAVQTDTLPIVQKLIDAGADVNKQTTEGDTALLLAAKSNLAVITALLGAGANLDVQNKLGFTPLMIAAHHNVNPAVVETLLDAGANPKLISSESKTAFDYAEKNKLLEGTNVYYRLKALSK